MVAGSIARLTCSSLTLSTTFPGGRSGLVMIAPTLVALPYRAATSAVVTAQPELIRGLVVITQTITNADVVYTTILTLGSGGSPAAPAAPVSGATSSSSGLTQDQIGIIVGCCVGAVVLVVLAWCILTMIRRKNDRDRQNGTPQSYSFTSSYLSSETTTPTVAQWATYHRQRPPVRPEYRAVDPGRRWTASRQATTTFIRPDNHHR